MERRRRSIFEYIDELRSRFEELFNEFEERFERPMSNFEKRCLEPLTEIKETPSEIIVTVDLPCVRKEDVKLHATENMLTIEALMYRKIKFDKLKAIYHKTEFQSYHKTVRLPSLVDPENARARFKHGILEVRLPKKYKAYDIKID
jgi:HSP20 family protein